ncbi:MAG: DUF4402 domain-containing protein [Bacteroidales bacterium]|nr:DUF4402 domain-containing protein [Bacteroidales bacterium]
MKFILQYITITLLLIIVGIRAQAQTGVAASMFAEVIAALTATENSQLSFGKFSPETNGGEIHLSPQGMRSVNGSVVLSGGGHSNGSFIITGEDQATFSISLPSGQSLLTNSTGTKTMIVKDWQSNPAPGIGAGVLIGGTLEVKVGATLVVGSMNDNPVGNYTGTYFITFAYN